MHERLVAGVRTRVLSRLNPETPALCPSCLQAGSAMDVPAGALAAGAGQRGVPDGQ